MVLYLGIILPFHYPHPHRQYHQNHYHYYHHRHHNHHCIVTLGDGDFVDRGVHEYLIEQKFVVIDEGAVNSEIIEERAVDIDRINVAIVELHGMYQDLSVLVKEQEAFVDAIVQNVEESHHKTELATGQITEARKLQRQSQCVVSWDWIRQDNVREGDEGHRSKLWGRKAVWKLSSISRQDHCASILWIVISRNMFICNFSGYVCMFVDMFIC